MLCCLLKLISAVTQVELPYKLEQRPLGFEIHDSNGMRFPLFLLTEAPADHRSLEKSKADESGLATRVKLKTLHLIRFEQAVVLLDQDV